MKRRIALHLVFWLTFWLMNVYTYSRYDGNLPKYLLTEGLQMPARMLATYAAMWCFEHFGKMGNQRYWLAFGGAALSVLAGGLLNRLLKFYYLVSNYFPDATIEFWNYRMVYDILDVLLATATALTARLFFRNQESQRREAAMRLEKLDAELLALKSQIHPHFLFNTINNLYALARKKSDKTAPAALKLAHLLRYVLYESSKSAVRIEQEIQLLQDYIELEKLRFDADRLRVTVDLQIDNPQQLISPLLLLPLVENAFKHGVSESRDDAWVSISIHLQAQFLTVNIENSYSPDQEASQSGIGLKNLERQLELIYPGRHEFTKMADDATFKIQLKLPL